MLVQSGKPVGVFRTHEWAPRVLLANSNLVGDWATWPEFRRLENLGLTMYGQMTAGSWIYIGTQGILQGTYETFAAVAAKRFGGTLAGTLTVTAGLRRHGRRAAARRDDERRRLPDDRLDPTRLRRRIEHRYLDEIADSLDDAIELARRRRATRARPSRSASSATPPRSCRSCCAADAPIDIVTDQTSAHDPLSYIPEGIDFDDCATTPRRTRGVHRARARRWPSTSRRWSASWTTAPRSSTTATPSATRRARAATTAPSTSPASSPPTSARCSARARARSAGRRSRGDPKDIQRPTGASSSCSPTTTTCSAGSRWRRSACLPGPARAHLLARLRRARQGRARVQRPGRQRRGQRADRHRPRPPRLRLGRLALPRDRGDARRLRRDRRLAAAQRHGQHRLRAPRGCRSTTAAASASAARSTPARSRRRRHAARRREAAARAHERPGHGRDPARRRRLRRSRFEVADERDVRIPMRENG